MFRISCQEPVDGMVAKAADTVKKDDGGGLGASGAILNRGHDDFAQFVVW
jgi:hypothetical protein